MPEPKDVEKMITKVMKRKDLSRGAAMHYIMALGVGKLLAQERYTASLPEGKASKGILAFTSDRARKRLAPKAPRLTTSVLKAGGGAETPKRKRKAKVKTKGGHAPADPRQTEIAAE